jgi:hypothetical protein
LPLFATGAGASRKLVKPGQFLSKRINLLPPLRASGLPGCKRAFRLLIEIPFDSTLHQPYSNLTGGWHHGIIALS